ncbi:MAG: DUF1587 domain-containing protein [Pirellulaceae bacterium]
MRTSLILTLVVMATPTVIAAEAELQADFNRLRPILRQFCFDCHDASSKEGELDLSTFDSVERVRQDLEPWQSMIVQLETGEMPPKDHPQPSDAERKQLIQWTRRFLDIEALSRAGDPGDVPLHRLSNTQYDNTIRDLTGVDMQPTREFPRDGVAGEGFTNAAEALSMSPTLMNKYLAAAKEISSHAVLLPDGFRFSQATTQRDQTDESLTKLRQFYHRFTPDGRLPLAPYLAALVHGRTRLDAGSLTIAELADERHLSPRYLTTLWNALQSEEASFPIDRLRALAHRRTE